MASAQTAAPTYFVATTGSDSNPGSQASPWRTIGKAAKAATPGSTVNVRGGVYAERVTIAVSGSASAGFITFQSFPGETAVLDGSSVPVTGEEGMFLISDRSYVRIKGFEIRNYRTASKDLLPVGIFVQGQSHHIEIRNNHIHHIETSAGGAGGNAHGIAVYGTSAQQAITNVVIDGNEVAHLKLGWSESVVLNGNVTNFEVTNNHIHDNDNIGIDFIGFEGTCPQRRLRSGAQRRLQRQPGVQHRQRAATPLTGGERSADGIYVDGGRDILIERNVVSGANFGIELGSEHGGKSTSNVTVRDNFISKSHNAGIAMGGYDTGRGSTRDCRIVNNTLFENDTLKGGFGEIYIQFDTRNNVIKNNILYANSQGRFISNDYTQNTGNLVDYNIFYAPGGVSAGRWQWKGREYAGFAAYQATGNDLHSKFVHPMFVDLVAPNLHLRAGSPAIGAGDGTVSAATDFDIDGEARVQGLAVDVGADEVAAGAGPPVPVPVPVPPAPVPPAPVPPAPVPPAPVPPAPVPPCARAGGAQAGASGQRGDRQRARRQPASQHGRRQAGHPLVGQRRWTMDQIRPRWRQEPEPPTSGRRQRRHPQRALRGATFARRHGVDHGVDRAQQRGHARSRELRPWAGGGALRADRRPRDQPGHTQRLHRDRGLGAVSRYLPAMG